GFRTGGRTAFLESRTGTGGHPFLKVRPDIVGQGGASERAQSNDHREEHTHHYFLQGGSPATAGFVFGGRHMDEFLQRFHTCPCGQVSHLNKWMRAFYRSQ